MPDFDLSTRSLFCDSNVFLRQAPRYSPSSITTITVLLPHSPIHSSSLTMYEQQVSTSRPWPLMRIALWSRNIWQSRKRRSGSGHIRYSWWPSLGGSRKQIKEKYYHSTYLATTDRSYHLQIQYKQHQTFQDDGKAWFRLLSGNWQVVILCHRLSLCPKYEVPSAIQDESLSFSRWLSRL